MEACEGKAGAISLPSIGHMLMYDVQNLAFAKDEAKFSMKKVQHKLTGGLGGREPDVETET